MHQIEPTYLRYVYDGLSKGSISSNNPTSLPIGFIGLFEDEFPSSMPLVERMSILNRLSTWALLKGPVSIEMVSEILDEHPDNTKALIDTYSKWFNSPEPGKYVLYHDRLRTYLLQKLSNHEVQDLNETLISYLENALSREGLKEAESYALEHLSTHMAVESQMGNNYERLHEFVNQEDLWKRQITTSNEYKWSQRAVQYGIKEGARRHYEINSLNSAVNSIIISQNEQNSAEQIINLLNSGDFELALKRAESFDGDKLMTIYLLMIHELTIGNSREAEFRFDLSKTIVKLISKIDLVEISFPPLLLYKYSEKLHLFGNIDYFIVWQKLCFGRNTFLNLMEYVSVDDNLLSLLIEEILSDVDKVPVYLKKAVIYFKNSKFDQGIDFFEKALSIIDKLVQVELSPDFFSNGNFGSVSHSHETYFRYIDHYLHSLFIILNHSFKISVENNLLDKAFSIQRKLKKINERINSNIVDNFQIINETGLNSTYFEGTYANDQILISNYIKLGEIKFKYYEKAKALNIKYLKEINQNKKYLDFFMSGYIKGGFQKYLYEIEFAKSLLAHNKIIDFNLFISSLDQDNLKAKVLLDTFESCFETQRQKKTYFIKQISNIIETLSFSQELFSLSEQFCLILLKNGEYDIGESFLNKHIINIDKLKNKNQKFVSKMYEKIILAYSFLGNYNKIEEFYDKYCEVETSLKQIDLEKGKRVLEDDIIYTNPLKNILGQNVKLESTKKLFDVTTSRLNKVSSNFFLLPIFRNEIFDQLDFIDAKNFIEKYDLIEDNKHDVIKNYEIKQKTYSWRHNKDSEFTPSWGLGFNESGFDFYDNQLLEYFNIGYFNNNLNINDLKEQLASADNCDFEIALMNDLFCKDEIQFLFENILSKTKHKIEIDSKQISHLNNYNICLEFCKKIDIDDALKVVDKFDLGDNISWDPTIINNAKIEVLLSRLNKNNTNKILNLIYSVITDIKPPKRYSRFDNKILAYERVFKFLKNKITNDSFYINIAKKFFKKWHTESSREILLYDNFHKDSKGYTFKMVELAVGVFSKKYICDLIDILIEENSDNSEQLLNISYLLRDLNFLDKSVKLAYSALNVIDEDPFIADDQRHEVTGKVASFFYSTGNFEIGDKIHNSISDYLFLQPIVTNYSQFKAKSDFYIKESQFENLLKFADENSVQSYSSRKCTYYDIIFCLKKLIDSKKIDIAARIIEFEFEKLKINLQVLDNGDFSKKVYLDLLDVLYYTDNKIYFNLIFDIYFSKLIDSNDERNITLSYNRLIKLNGSKFITVDFDLLKEKNKSIEKLIKTKKDSKIDDYSNQKTKYSTKNLHNGEFYRSLALNPDNFFDDKFNNDEIYNYLCLNFKSQRYLKLYLHHVAKMSCFFGENKKDFKLKLINSVINISPWIDVKSNIDQLETLS